GATGATGSGTTGATGGTGPTGPTGPVGCASANYILKSNGTTATCTVTPIYEDGTNLVVGIGTTSPASTYLPGETGVGLFNVHSVSQPGTGYFPVEVSNNSTNNACMGVGEYNTGSGYNALEGISFYTGTTFVPCGVLGLQIQGSGLGIGVRGIGNYSNHYGVVGSIPTTGTWTGFGGYFTGGLAYANGLYNLSDSSVKKNVLPLRSSLDKIMHLQGVSYQYDTDAMPSSKGDERVYLGFIAQEIERTLPQVVATKNVMVGEGSTKLNAPNQPLIKTLKVVDYVQVVPVLVEAMKEQQKIIDELKKKLEAQDKKTEEIQKLLNEQLKKKD
ncbi:MAG: hypothetical protein JWO06_1045, partial [Bacteroidota bacterium]|nr:hypothetical protein [Bacteroidota bacterium]